MNYVINQDTNQLIYLGEYRIVNGVLDGIGFSPDFYFRDALTTEVEVPFVRVGSRLSEAYLANSEMLASLERGFEEFKHLKDLSEEYYNIVGGDAFIGGSFNTDAAKEAGVNTILEAYDIDDMLENGASTAEIIDALEKAISDIKTAYIDACYTLISSWSTGTRFSLKEEMLCRTINGSYFLIGMSSSDREYADTIYDNNGNEKLAPGQKIIPMDEDDVYEWLTKNCPDHPLLAQ